MYKLLKKNNNSLSYKNDINIFIKEILKQTGKPKTVDRVGVKNKK